MSFVAETESGHAVVMDGAPEGGGRNLGPRPVETVLAGTGGCTAYDVVVILKKSKQQVTGCDVQLQAERAETDPKVFTKIHMHFVVRGRALKPSMVEQLGVSRPTVQLWRKRVREQGIGEVWEIAPGRGRKPQYDQATRDGIIQATLRSKPKGMTHWSCRLMAEEQEVSKNTVNRLWQLHNP